MSLMEERSFVMLPHGLDLETQIDMFTMKVFLMIEGMILKQVI